jgi:uncharacterized membrane protein
LDRNVTPRDDTVARSDVAASVGISRTLFFGLLVSIALMILGLILVAPERQSVATRVVALDRIIPDLLAGSRPALLDTGILVLFATPLLGVLVAFMQFLRQRDTTFSLITAILLLVLGAGFVVALH